MSGDDYIPEPGEPISPGALRTIAGWLDTYDQMASLFWDILEASGQHDPERIASVRKVTTDKTIQNDLRRWADEMERTT